MKFEEKLIKLRKENALSQEELGEKLNVTRQTVSKWELGQTKPDLKKLLEISKIYNVSLESLTSDGEKTNKKENVIIENESENEPRKWLQVLLIIVALIIIVVLVNKFITDRNKESTNGFLGIFNGISSKFYDITSNFENDKKSFNFSLEARSGTQTGAGVGFLLDNIITSNKTNDKHLITVTYNGNKATEESEIVSMKQSLDSLGEYEVSMDYNEDGYIYNINFHLTSKHIEEKAKREAEEKTRNLRTFNSSYEIYVGTKWGISCETVLDKVATNNKTNSEHLISISYEDNETSNSDEITKIKQTLNNKTNKWKEFEVSLDYDKEGYVCKIIIKKI